MPDSSWCCLTCFCCFAQDCSIMFNCSVVLFTRLVEPVAVTCCCKLCRLFWSFWCIAVSCSLLREFSPGKLPCCCCCCCCWLLSRWSCCCWWWRRVSVVEPDDRESEKSCLLPERRLGWVPGWSFLVVLDVPPPVFANQPELEHEPSPAEGGGCQRPGTHQPISVLGAILERSLKH